MRFALTADHRTFFQKHHFIAFEDLLSTEQTAVLKNHTDKAIAARLRIPVSKIADRSSSELFLTGYDLWREDDTVKKIAHKHELARLGSELFQIVPLRCAFDQYIATVKGSTPPFTQPLSLQDTSCLSPLAGALILTLEDLAQPLPSFPLPIRAGHGLYVSAHFPLPWPEVYAIPGVRLLVIAFSQEKTFFRADTRDPHAAALKKLGYVYNDMLRDSLHPLLNRKQ